MSDYKFSKFQTQMSMLNSLTEKDFYEIWGENLGKHFLHKVQSDDLFYMVRELDLDNALLLQKFLDDKFYKYRKGL